MARTMVFRFDEYGERVAEGWFDPDRCAWLEQASRWDGQRHVGLVVAEANVETYLYRTPGGRWVEEIDRRRYAGGSQAFRFLDDEQARNWIITNGADGDEESEQWLETYFPQTPPERGPGQPQIGERVSTTLPWEHLQVADRLVAGGTARSRSDAIRQLVAAGVAATPIPPAQV